MYYQRSLLYRVLDSFFRHKVIFLVSSLTVITLVTAYLVLRPKTYVGGYTVIQDNRTLSNPLVNTQQSNWDDIDSAVDHLQSLIATQDFISQALKNPDGTPVSLRYPIDLNNTDQLMGLRKAINVSDSASDSFSVNMEYKDPEDARKIMYGIIETYISQTAQEKSAYFSADVSFIQQQVDAYRLKLSDAEKALTNFKAQNANNLPSEQDAIEQQMVTYQSQLQDLQIQLAEDQQRQQYLESQLSQVPHTIITAQTAAGSPLVAQLQNLEVQLTTDIAVKQMKPTHPEVIALQQQIIRLKQVILAKSKSGDAEYKGLTSTNTEPNPLYQSLQGELVQVQIDQRATQAKQSATQQLLTKATSGAALVPTAERTLTNLERDYSTYNNSYNNLMTRLQEAQINEELNLRQAQSAYTVLLTSPPVSSQSKSKIMMMFVGGLILALLIGCSLVLLSEWLDRSLRDPLDTQRVLSLPVLAVLPEVKALNSNENKDRPLLGSRSDELSGASKVLAG
jgi:succinoglycan biosynthesis transport protein ExoP